MEQKSIEKKTPLNFFIFNKDELLRVLSITGLELNKDNIVVSKGEVVHCNCCGDIITKDNFGRVMPGSRIVICDKPACFASYMAKKRV